MRKIPTIFERDWDDDRSRVIDKPHPDCAWVFAGEGVPTRKLDGTCCLIKDGRLWKRREIKAGTTEPPDFKPVDVDYETGKQVGWVPVGNGPEDKWHREAFLNMPAIPDGTYELIGPKVQGNHEQNFLPISTDGHYLIAHDDPGLGLDGSFPRTFTGIASYLAGKDIEGIVFHHPDGRMGKIKLRDFGLKRHGA
jgi:hypothetical protein